MRFESKLYTINDKEVTREEWINSEEDGSYKSYDNNGQLEGEWNYRNGEPHGFYKSWYSDGQLCYDYNYQNGLYHGFQRRWDIAGRLEYEVFYAYGKEREDLLLPKNRLAYLVIFGEELVDTTN